MLEEVLKEIAAQLKRIADNMGGSALPKPVAAKVEKAVAEAVEPAKEETGFDPCTSPLRDNSGDYSEDERKAIKTALEEKGVEFSGRCATNTLHKILLDSVQDDAASDDEPLAVPEIAEASPDEVKANLMEYVKKNGRDAGAKLLAEFDAQNWSGIKAENLQKLNARIKELMNV